MKMCKRLGAIILTLAFLISMIGCGSKTDNTSAEKSAAAVSTAQESSTPEAVKEPVTIKYVRWASGEEEKTFRGWLDEFQKINPNITVESEFLPWDTYWQKLKTDLVSGEPADVISFYWGGWLPYSYSDVFEDLNTMPGAAEVFADIAPGAVQAYSVEGKLLAAPIGIGRRIPFINVEMFEKAGIALPPQDKPLTIKEWTEILKKLKAANPGKDFTPANFEGNELLHALVASLNGSPIISNDGIKVTINTPEGINALNQWKEFYTSGLVVPYAEFATGAYGHPDDSLKTKKVAVSTSGNWAIAGLKDAGIKYLTVPLPIAEGGKASVTGFFNGNSISKTSKQKEAAWELIKFMESKDGQVSFGKFGDLPSNLKALGEMEGVLGKEAIGGFTGGNPEILNSPSWPADFGAIYTQGVSDFLAGKVTAEQFAAKLEKDGQPLMDKYISDLKGSN